MTQEDDQTLVPLWEQAIAKDGKVRLLWWLDDFQGWHPAAAVEDLRFDFQHHDQVERLAVIGENWWDVWMTKVTDLIFPQSEARYFPPEQLAAAWDRVTS